jgi:hypothetical protein
MWGQCSIWTAKLTVSEFLKRLTSNFWKREYEIALQIIRGFLVATFIAVVIATLAECQPFDHYWQVVPNPGPQCRQGYTQLITMGTADMITDVLLIFFPIPIVIRSSAFKLKRKISLILLFSMSAILVGITAYRVKSVINHGGSQQYRSVFASGEILAATAVANAVIIGSFLRDRGVKKQKYKYNSSTASTSGRTSRRQTLTALNNDSDSDLFRDMCYRTASELEAQFVPRAPPIAASPETTRDDVKVANGYFSGEGPDSLRDSSESDPRTAVEHGPPLSPTSPTFSPDAKAASTSPNRRRTVSFCDPGGLLEDGSSRSSTLAPSPATTTSAQDFASSTTPFTRRGSRNILADLGGLLSPILSAHRRPSDEKEQLEMDDQQGVFMTPANSSRSPPTSSARRMSTPLAPIQAVDNDLSFHDIGGLLGPPTNPASPGPSRKSSAIPRSASNSRRPSPMLPSPPRHPSDADESLQDIGGLLGPPSIPGSHRSSRTPSLAPPSTSNSRRASPMRPSQHEAGNHQSLRDVGGLLDPPSDSESAPLSKVSTSEVSPTTTRMPPPPPR